jgi:hypothetical protein
MSRNRIGVSHVMYFNKKTIIISFNYLRMNQSIFSRAKDQIFNGDFRMYIVNSNK